MAWLIYQKEINGAPRPVGIAMLTDGKDTYIAQHSLANPRSLRLSAIEIPVVDQTVLDASIKVMENASSIVMDRYTRMIAAVVAIQLDPTIAAMRHEVKGLDSALRKLEEVLN